MQFEKRIYEYEGRFYWEARSLTEGVAFSNQAETREIAEKDLQASVARYLRQCRRSVVAASTPWEPLSTFV